MSELLSIDKDKYDKYISIVEKQETMLRFPRFSRKDAWALGQLMVSRILGENLVLSVSIRLINGFVLFQYMPEGTTLNNEDWMTRKFNVVRDLEISSLLNTLKLRKNNKTLEDKGLDSRLYAASGGGFPLHVAGTGMIGVLVVSGLPHLADHEFIVESVNRFLNIPELPRLPPDAKV